MTIQSGHVANVFAVTHLELALPYRQPKPALRYPLVEELKCLNTSFSRAYPLEETVTFEDLLTAIDDADDRMGRLALDRK